MTGNWTARARIRVAPLWRALPVAHTGGCAPPAGVRVQLPRPAAGHPWPAGSTPPDARDGLRHSPAPARKSTAVSAGAVCNRSRSCVQQSTVSRFSGAWRSTTAAAEVVNCRDGLTLFAVDLLSDATTVRGPPWTQGDVQSRPWTAGGRMWEQDAEISGWASPCGSGGPAGTRRALAQPERNLLRGTCQLPGTRNYGLRLSRTASPGIRTCARAPSGGRGLRRG